MLGCRPVTILRAPNTAPNMTASEPKRKSPDQRMSVERAMLIVLCRPDGGVNLHLMRVVIENRRRPATHDPRHRRRAYEPIGRRAPTPSPRPLFPPPSKPWSDRASCG